MSQSKAKTRLVILLVVFSFMFVLSGCFYTAEDLANARADGYDAGFEDGYDEAEAELAADIEKSYDLGYEEGFDAGVDYSEHEMLCVLDEAFSFARKSGGWSVYEAWNNVFIYFEGDPYFGTTVTKNELFESAYTLANFAMFIDECDFDFD